jgi:hypothetical protein
LEKNTPKEWKEIIANCDTASEERLEKLAVSLNALFNHFKAFDLAFFYINFGFV